MLYTKTNMIILRHFNLLLQIKETKFTSKALPPQGHLLSHCSYTLFGQLYVDFFFALCSTFWFEFSWSLSY